MLPSDTPRVPEDTAAHGTPDRVDTHDSVDTRPPSKRFLGLSLSQILGGSMAATTAAFLGARLGLAGTVAGAATASVVSAIASAAYAHSIERTRSFLRTTRVVTTTSRRIDAVDPATPPREVLAPVPPRPRTLRLDLRRVGLATVAVFVATVVVVTGYEFVSGRALDGHHGTTVSQVVGGAKGDTAPSDGATTPSPSATTTATVTVTTTQGPSSSTTGQPQPSSSTSGQTSPPPTTDPSAPDPASTSPTP